MTMATRLRRFAFTAHVTFSVGWLGAVVAYLALAITALTSHNVQLVRSAYLSMELIGWFVIVPLAFASLVSGLVQSLGTEWGLFRHYWILAKFLLTIFGTAILLGHMKTVSRVAGTTFPSADLGRLPHQLVIHPVGGLLILLVATILAIYKPWGRTPYGRRLLERGKTPL